MLCEYCGSQTLPNARYCVNCGERLGAGAGKGRISAMEPTPVSEPYPEPEIKPPAQIPATEPLPEALPDRPYDPVPPRIIVARDTYETEQLEPTSDYFYEPPEPALSEKARRWGFSHILALLTIAVLAGVSIFVSIVTGWYKTFPFFAPSEENPLSASSNPSAPPGQSAPSRGEAESSAPAPPGDDVAPIEYHPPVDFTPWPDFGYVSPHYTLAKEDDRYIYYLPPGSALIRIDKQNNMAETMFDVSDHGYKTIESFALFGNHLYFTVRMDQGRTGYFRIHRGGGQAEFIFTDSSGILFTQDDMLLVAVKASGDIAEYDPAADIFPRPLPGFLPEGYDLKTLACVDGVYYYHDGHGAYFGIEPEEEAVPLLLELPGEVYDPFLIKNTVFFVYRHEGSYTIAVADPGTDKYEAVQFLSDAQSGQAPFFAAMDGYFVWWQGGALYSASIGSPQVSRQLLATQAQPAAVTREWVLWPESAYHPGQGKLIDLSRPRHNTFYDIGPALGQAAMAAEGREIRNTILTEPVALND